MKKYQQAYDNIGFRPAKRGYKMRCCDCGLVHKMNFSVVRGTSIINIKASRDNRATAASRRSKNYKRKLKELARQSNR